MKRNNYHRELIALGLVPKLGSHRIGLLLKHFDSPSEIFKGDVRKIRQINGLGPKIASEISMFKKWEEVDRILDLTKRSGALLLSSDNSGYPPLLKQIYDYPPLMWVKGDIEALSKPGIAVIGTRNADRYGRIQAELWSRQIVCSGLSVISGLAYGIDTIAHQAALKENGVTTAILGSGIDWIYPERNNKLANQIINNGGAVATEFPPGTKPDAGNFPVRNRIVSGICLGVLVIQSGLKGGSMITARSALDQNREVFVIPHNLDQKRGEGNNYLIKNGQGKLVNSIEDILNEIPFHSSRINNSTDTGHKLWTTKDLNGIEYEICSALAEGYNQIDKLAEQTGKATYELLPILLELEMEGLIAQSAGKYFELK